MSHSQSSMERKLAKFLTIPLLIALCSALFCGNAERLHARLLWLGENLFTGYFQLQSDPPPPRDCEQLFQESPTPSQTADEDELEDLFEEEEASPRPTPTAKSDDDELEDLFGEEDGNQEEQAKQKALAQKKAKEKCEAEKLAYVDITSRITTGVKIFRVIEGSVSGFIAWVVAHFKHFLALIFILGALIASVQDEHIALRPASSTLAYRLRHFTQMVAFGFVTLSTWYYREQLTLSEEKSLNLIWLVGLLLLTLWHLGRLVTKPNQAATFTNQDSTIGATLLSIPLFAVMGWSAGIFFFSTDHPRGLAIELTKLTEHAILYVNVALYVWVGMLLKQSILTTRIFDLLRPLRLEPTILAAVVVVGAAIPTAYSGASGIFVIAAGALIYEELRKAGARRHLALAATAMSGSLGVVLSPCLLVVIIASLNEKVTTDELYHWGVWVFMLTAILFVLCLRAPVHAFLLPGWR